MPQETEPKLDAPGAGLPAPMLFVAKRVSLIRARLGTREKFLTEFGSEQAKIAKLIEPLSSDQRGQRILIPRLIGLEDSSRFYSVWMTLDHLRITNLAFASIIKQLSQGHVPDIMVSTADVKPDPEVTQEIEKDYKASCRTFLATIRKLPELKTEAQLNHPWFGPMNAHRWLSLSAFHMGIHRRQIKAITQRL
ncbi:MAG: DinB family protein [Roseibacillus sp.]